MLVALAGALSTLRRLRAGSASQLTDFPPVQILVSDRLGQDQLLHAGASVLQLPEVFLHFRAHGFRLSAAGGRRCVLLGLPHSPICGRILSEKGGE